MNRTIRPAVAFAILIILVVLFVAGTGAGTCTSGTASAVMPPTLTGWVDADMRQQWVLSWMPESGGGLVTVSSDSEDVSPEVTCTALGGRTVTLQGAQDGVNRVSVRIPAGMARCDAYMGGRPASQGAAAFNHVHVGGVLVIGVIDRADPRVA
nr:MAG TPA: Protein of unknown function (DUF3568) [Caudoviricetes sp.]